MPKIAEVSKTTKTETIDITTNELAEQLRLDRMVVYGLIKYLETTGVATIKEVRPNPAGKGKGSNVYTIPKKIIIDL